MNTPPLPLSIEAERTLLGEPTRQAKAPVVVVFESSWGPLFGFHHVACSPWGRAGNVVLCPPVGYDAMLTHRTYRHLAERLSLLGFHVLRFDYHGTGDSSGRPDEPNRIQAWLDSIDAAIEALAARTGLRQTTLFGVRTGGLLAAASADRRSDVSTLVLWAPGQSGRLYVREFRAFNAKKLMSDSATRVPNGSDGVAASGADECDEVVAGYFFSAETLTALSRIDLMKLELGAVKRALVLARDDVPGVEPRLVAHWVGKGVHAENPNVAGYAGMMRDAEFSTLPDAAIGYIVEWLATAHRPVAHAMSEDRGARAASVLHTQSRAGVPIVERALACDDEGRLFGILTERGDPVAERARTVMLLLNVGSNHHVGPHRMYVTLSRELSALGFRAFRFDVAGLGDSRTRPGVEENSLYSEESIGDVQRAITFLARATGAERFVLLGICSGAYLAFHTTAADPRVSGQILVNPQTFEWRKGDSLELKIKKQSFKATRYYRRALFEKRTWERLYRRDVNIRAIADELMVRARRHLIGRLTRVLSSSNGMGNVARSFAAISDRGTHSLLVYSGNDGGIDVIESHLGARGGRMRRRKNFRFEIIEGADHTMTPLAAQAELERLVLGYVRSVFG